MEVDIKKTIKPRLTSKKYKEFKLNMTQHGLNVDAFDAMAKAYTDEEREKHRVIANSSGKCTDVFIGQVLHWGNLESQWESGQEDVHSKFIWAMDDSGNLYVDFSNNSGGIFHSTMMGGYRPIGAGEICIVHGYIVFLNEESGHYAPNRRLGMVVEELQNQGFKLPGITIRNSEHSDRIMRVEKLTVRQHLIERNKLAAGLKTEKWLDK